MKHELITAKVNRIYQVVDEAEDQLAMGKDTYFLAYLIGRAEMSAEGGNPALLNRIHEAAEAFGQSIGAPKPSGLPRGCALPEEAAS